MMPPDRLEELWGPYRYELGVANDYVGLWELVRRVRKVLPALDDESVRATVLTMIERALERSEAEAGTWPRGADGLEVVSREPTHAIIERIRREWSELGREPEPGDVVWLQPPRTGASALTAGGGSGADRG